VVLANKWFTERGGYQDQRWEVVIFIERKAIA
jgi:hypothetical protein